MGRPVLFLLVVTTSAVLGQVRNDEQSADGSPSFQYFSDEGKTASQKILKYMTDLDEALDNYVDDLKTSNNASAALKKYNAAVDAVKGTNCALSGSDIDAYSDAQKDITQAVESCASFAPKQERDVLLKRATEALAKVQAADNTLKLNSMLCFSLRVPESDSCKQDRKKALETIQDVVSDSEDAKFKYDFRTAFSNTKKYLESCVQKANQDLEDTLDVRTKDLQDCKASL